MGNHTYHMYFQILVFDYDGGRQILLFPIFLLLYVICLLWNMLIIAVISMDRYLQTPMYFFLRSLSCVDIFYISDVLPKLMHILLTGNNRISFIACFIQLYFFTSMACTEIFLLTAMAYDRYVAICKPLHYTVFMKRNNCILLVMGSWISGHCNSFFVTFVSSQISFCGPNTIHQLFCEIKSMIRLSCGHPGIFLTVMYLETWFMGFCPFLCILLSYIKILTSILKAHLAGKKNKAFSTCTSHLITITIFYGTLFCVYLIPPSTYSQNYDQVFSVLFLVVIPTVNPLIYSLRNKEMKNALKRIAKVFT